MHFLVSLGVGSFQWLGSLTRDTGRLSCATAPVVQLAQREGGHPPSSPRTSQGLGLGPGSFRGKLPDGATLPAGTTGKLGVEILGCNFGERRQSAARSRVLRLRLTVMEPPKSPEGRRANAGDDDDASIDGGAAEPRSCHSHPFHCPPGYLRGFGPPESSWRLSLEPPCSGYLRIGGLLWKILPCPWQPWSVWVDPCCSGWPDG